MSKYIKIECGASLSYQGCEAVDVYETDITIEEWEDLEQDSRDEIIQDYLDNHLGRYADSWASVID